MAQTWDFGTVGQSLIPFHDDWLGRRSRASATAVQQLAVCVVAKNLAKYDSRANCHLNGAKFMLGITSEWFVTLE